MVIYKIINKLNGKIYIGKRIWSKEKFIKSKYYGSGTYIRRAIKKYGLENFSREVICECISREDMGEKERYYIKSYECSYPNGYNILPGGSGGENWFVHKSEEDRNIARHNMSLAAPKTKTEAHKNNIRKTHIGIKRTWYSSGFTGHNHTPEFKEWQSNRVKKMRWFTNGREDIYLRPDEEVPNGFVSGRSLYKRTKYGEKNGKQKEISQCPENT